MNNLEYDPRNDVILTLIEALLTDEHIQKSQPKHFQISTDIFSKLTQILPC